MTPCTSPKVISRNSSPISFVNQSNNNSGNNRQGTPTSQTFNPTVARTNIMVENDIKLPIFNGNGLEDPKQHWFLCEAMWTVQHDRDESIKKSKMITTLRGRALDLYMKFYVAPIGVLQKTLDQI